MTATAVSDKELATLRSQIDKAAYAYYRKRAIVADAVFDFWLEQLRSMCPDDPRLTQVGSQYTTDEIREKTPHDFPCGSLDNIDGSIGGYPKWLGQFPAGSAVMASLKMDGNSLDLKYEDGQLVRAVTRGNGEVGDDVTANAIMFNGVQTSLPTNFTGNIRGEAILSRKAFEELDEEGEDEELSNPRNVGSGIIGRKDGTQSDMIDFIAFGMYPSIAGKRQILDFDIQYKMLADNGFQVVEHELCTTPAQVTKFFDSALARRDSLPYDIDGVVVQLNDGGLRDSLVGNDPQKLKKPVYGRAIKPPTKMAVSVLLDVTVTVGHTRALIPTGLIKTVKIGGAQVDSPLLNNWDEIERLGIQIGDEVLVGLAGDVIPKVYELHAEGKNRKPILPPTACPACGSAVIKEKNGKPHANHFCTNEACPAALTAKIMHWIGNAKKGVGILGVGDKIIEALTKSGKVQAPADLYVLSADELAVLDLGKNKLGRSRAEAIVTELEEKKTMPLAKFLGAIGIDMLGRRRAEQLIKGSGGLLYTIEQWLEGNVEKVSFHGFGVVQKAIISQGVAEHIGIIRRLLDVGVVPTPYQTVQRTNGKVDLTGISFCFTGTRDGEPEIIAAGGINKTGVSKGLHYLVQKDPLSQTKKSQKALELGTKVIGVDFLKKVLAGEAQLP